MPKLFVYGTLRRGSNNPHARALESQAVWLGRAAVRAEVRQVSWFSGLKLGGPDEAVSSVEGEVWDVPDLLLEELDEYEGAQFLRIEANVTMESGAIADCWIYTYKPAWPL